MHVNLDDYLTLVLRQALLRDLIVSVLSISFCLIRDLASLLKLFAGQIVCIGLMHS